MNSAEHMELVYTLGYPPKNAFFRVSTMEKWRSVQSGARCHSGNADVEVDGVGDNLFPFLLDCREELGDCNE